MKKLTLLLAVGLLMSLAFPQELKHVAGVVNVEVPVRVFNGERFVDNLTIADFELTENGVPQKIAAVYLVNKTAVLKKEENKVFEPDTHRTFFLFFEIHEYLPMVEEALSYFVRNVLTPQDDLMIVTSARTYNMKREILVKLSKTQVAEQLKAIVRKDTVNGNGEYRSAMAALISAVKEISPGSINGKTRATPSADVVSAAKDVTPGALDIDQALETYKARLEYLESLRTISEKKLLSFAKLLKNVEGQKQVFMFYQQEFIPILDKKTIYQYIDMFDVSTQMTLQELFSFQKRSFSLNTDLIKKSYADSAIAIHFLYLTPLPGVEQGVVFEEHSEDIFPQFLDMARATGGIAESTSNPAFAMKQASEASENYYLLYYAPDGYRADGQFREVKVSVKGKDYRVSNRAGYFAN